MIKDAMQKYLKTVSTIEEACKELMRIASPIRARDIFVSPISVMTERYTSKYREYMYSDSSIQPLDRKKDKFLSVHYKRGGWND